MNKVSGKIKEMFPSIVRGTFEKRLFWLEEVVDKYPNTFQLEFWNADCKMPEVMNLKKGDFITAYYDMKGKVFIKTDGEEAVGNSMKCWNIEKEGVIFKEIK